jgi:glycosyltransferase involved in cell wall biosynthesis
VIAKTWLTAVLADRIVYNSEAVRREYEALYRYPPSRGVVIPNAVGVAVYKNSVAGAGILSRPHAPRELLPSGPSLVTVGFVGRIGADKRLDVLLRAVAAMERRGQIRVALYGQGAEMTSLKGLTAELGIANRVAWPGITQDPPGAYADMDIVVLCSPRESSSNMALEAMAAGKAVVVTNAGGMPELVEHGRCGLVAPATDVPALAAALDRLVAAPELRSELGDRAQRKALRDHSPRDVGRCWLSLLSQVSGITRRRE